MADKEEKGPSPGAARFGNFINYYEFNRPEARLTVLPDDSDDLFAGLLTGQTKGITCLDVGCNTGEMTFALQEHLTSSKDVVAHFLAVDLDNDLVGRALESLEAKRRRLSKGEITFRQLDIMDVENRTATCREYLRTKGSRNRFDVVFCLSVTMWIHVNHGDEGLDSFLRFIASSCEWLLVEPQPWKCYTRAARRMRRVGIRDDQRFFLEQLDSLKVRGTGGSVEDVVERHIDRVLTSDECGMIKWKTFGLTPWKRSLVLYKNKSIELNEIKVQA